MTEAVRGAVGPRVGGINSWGFALSWRPGSVSQGGTFKVAVERVEEREGFQAQGKVCVKAKACWVSHMVRCLLHIYNEPPLSAHPFICGWLIAPGTTFLQALSSACNIRLLALG